MRFLSHLSAIVPAMKQNSIEGKKENTDNNVILEAVPFCPYTQTMSAKLVIAVPRVDTDCEPHRIKKFRRSDNIFGFFIALLLQIFMIVLKWQSLIWTAIFILPLHAIPVQNQTLHGASTIVRIIKAPVRILYKFTSLYHSYRLNSIGFVYFAISKAMTRLVTPHNSNSKLITTKQYRGRFYVLILIPNK